MFLASIVSIPPPDRIGVAVLLVVVGEVARLVLADHAEQHDPVEQLAADIAGLPHPLRRRLRDDLVELAVADAAVQVLRPFDVGHAVALAGIDLRPADLEREAAGRDHRRRASSAAGS